MSTQLPPSETESEAAVHDPAKLAALAPGTFCFHRSWGYGKIREHNELLSQVVIDFKGKSGHAMAFAYATESLLSLPATHIHAQKTENLEGVKKQAKDDPAGLVRVVIDSLGAQATAEVIQTTLSPEVVSEGDWKKWWEGAKRALKKAGHYHVPTRKNEAFRVLDAPLQVGNQAVDQFRVATGIEQQLAALSPVVKNWGEINDPAVAAEIAQTLDSGLSKLPKSQLAKGVELALLRDEFLAAAGLPKVEGALSLLSLVPTASKPFADLLEKISGPRQVRLLTAIQNGRAEEWPALFLQVLPFANGRMADSVTTVFAAVGRPEEVVKTLQRILRERAVTADLVYWLCKNRDELFASLFTAQLFSAILSVLETDQFSDLKKGTKLYDLIHQDKDLIALLLKDAPRDDIRDVTRAILLTPVFKELDKRSLLAILIKLFPDMQDLVIGGKEEKAEDATLIVSWDSLDRRKTELEEVVTKKIPENSKEIGIARSYGDLRENHEFKAAKEMQTVLMRRKAELESMLLRSQGTDFSHADTTSVNIGTIVDLTDTVSGEKLTYTVLGAWDSDVAKGILSYMTALAQALLKHPVGDIVQLSTEDGGEKTVRIDAIRPFKS